MLAAIVIGSVGAYVAKAHAGTCTTTCQQYGNQRTCYTNCY
jgi:uncharacterized membrane protein YeaQ/YmgE (transglycosylase-associated protein family)